MRTIVLVLIVAAASGLLAAPVSLQDLGPMGPSPYDLVDDWMKPFAEDGYAWGAHTGVFAESPDRIFITQRGELRLPNPVPTEWAGFAGSIGIDATEPEEGQRVWRNCIFIVDGGGNLVETWDQWDHLFEGEGSNGPHKISVNLYDPERKVYVVHETAHQVFAFSNDGSELAMTLGEKDVAGDDESHLGRPQDIAFLPDGSILVADGLDNSRIVWFDAEGNYLTHFGQHGNRRGYFNGVHGVTTDSEGRIYVADRDNDRVQVFNQTTRAAAWYHPDVSPIAIWPVHQKPVDVITSGYDTWVVANDPVRIIKFDLNGNFLYSWNMEGDGPGQYGELHQMSVDSNGNLYAVDDRKGRTLKFVLKADAEPGLAVGIPDLASP